MWQRVLSGAEKNVNTERLPVQTYSKTLERGGLEDRVSWAMAVHSRLHYRKHTPQAHPMLRLSGGASFPLSPGELLYPSAPLQIGIQED